MIERTYMLLLLTAVIPYYLFKGIFHQADFIAYLKRCNRGDYE